MDIAALSIASSQLSTQQSVGVSVLKKAMDQMDSDTSGLLNMMVPPSSTIGTRIDISA
jgi:hypothetical protein